jgi:hypothetical protein
MALSPRARDWLIAAAVIAAVKIPAFLLSFYYPCPPEALEIFAIGFLLLPSGILFVGLVFLLSQGVHTAPEQVVFAATLLGCFADVALLRWLLSRAHKTGEQGLRARGQT